MQPEHKLKSIQYLICLHLQATCDDKEQLKPCQETIQISAILINTNDQESKILGKFHKYVRPKCNPKLTQFCYNKTGIKSQTLKGEADIEKVLAELGNWINKFQFIKPQNFTFLTWGIWPIKSCLLKQIKAKKLNKPDFIHSFTDLKRIYINLFANLKDDKISVFEAAKNLNVQFKNEENQTVSQKAVQNLAEIAKFLYNNKKFQPERRYLTIISDLPNVNVVKELQYLLVLDFEATCEDGVKLKPCSQIIQFPVMVVDLKHKKVIAQFHQYVTPTYNPKLTPFCTDLTGITQQMVDNKLKLQKVLQKLDKWIIEQTYLHSKNYTFVTCGDWDLCSCLKNEAKTKNIQYEEYLKNYINIKKVYKQCLPEYDGSLGMMGMLNGLKIPHEGRHHSGIDDVRNICNICINLIDLKGFKFKKNYINYIK